MKNTAVKVVVIAMLLSVLLNLLTGCFMNNGVVDGPGMVNYQGLMLDELRGDWCESDNGSYTITFWDDYTFNFSYNYEPVIENAALTLYPASANMDEYSEFEINPNVFTDEAGGSVEIIKAAYENGTVMLVLKASDGTSSTLTFRRASETQDDLQPLDGPGMVYYGGVLDEALTGCWYSADGRYTLDFDGKCADFFADGVQLASQDYGYFVDHGFSENDDLNERCELYPTGSFLDDFDEPPLTISEMWYQAEHIYMNVIHPDGAAEEIVFTKQADAMP